MKNYKIKILGLITLMIIIFLLSCTSTKDLTSNLNNKDKIVYNLDKTKKLNKKFYKNYAIKTDFDIKTKLYAVYYDLNNDSIIDVCGFYKLYKINLKKHKCTYSRKAIGTLVNYNEFYIIYYISSDNDGILDYKFIEYKKNDTINNVFNL